MLFAAFDFLAYLAERGRYSPEALAASGWQPVTPETLAEADNAPPASVFCLHPRRSILSWVVMYGTNSVASHTAIYLGGGYVCDATTKGVGIRPLGHVLSERCWFVDNRMQPIPEETRARLVQNAVKLVGTPFGWATVVRIGAMQATGARDQTHPRLWADTILLLTLPAFTAKARSKRIRAALAAPAVAYACLLAAQRVARASARQPDKILRSQDQAAPGR